MANEKNTVPHREGKDAENLLPCCGEKPRQGWSFMGNFIWCDKCRNKLHSVIFDSFELGDQWNEQQERTNATQK